ncbi:helix-turn-helix domain-containing protein [Shimazuella sp. AN120528]|uniref:helix-turn-helix domain-containing protein n=1 Tax=Shimazuella soli TaxID=1892854 RepID=UPI001F0EE7F4|nr:helix-turn-helix transcriptional regulator [Shimazuella soli]MCH5583662.1 helix-turn-helix domain-containing protein [Shimazuella soli]
MVKNTLLQTARLQMGWSQQQLADFAQLSLSTIERAEGGKQIRTDSVQRLCQSLKRTPEEY